MPKDDKGHDGKKTESSQEEQLMDEQYEFGLNEDTREKMENSDNNHKEPSDKADDDDEVVDED